MYLQPGQNFGPNICWRKCFSANCSNDVLPFGAIAFMQILLRKCRITLSEGWD